ncbi:pentapeptide repeat-containing protein [Actinokineospora cianjurensis]|uniref:Pentapeptide repeat protein n=1 Tax=Actinokineospora cianjurensis TaxID=585224 RepID=A0A421AX50_9PSEU|nr:pentapeptide repeat-containing protein [Actinokineospora cianjurensis]RLK54417.1 hypothetical protein CLV68_5967 [Actinokineospora cianjurensis]
MEPTIQTVRFREAIFTCDVQFSRATFDRNADFERATFRSDAVFSGAGLPSVRYTVADTPAPWTTFSGARFEGGGLPAEVPPFLSAPDVPGPSGKRAVTGVPCSTPPSTLNR